METVYGIIVLWAMFVEFVCAIMLGLEFIELAERKIKKALRKNQKFMRWLER